MKKPKPRKHRQKARPPVAAPARPHAPSRLLYLDQPQPMRRESTGRLSEPARRRGIHPVSQGLARVAAYSAEDRAEIGVLLLPVLLLAFALTLGQSLKPGARWADLVLYRGAPTQPMVAEAVIKSPRDLVKSAPLVSASPRMPAELAKSAYMVEISPRQPAAGEFGRPPSLAPSAARVEVAQLNPAAATVARVSALSVAPSAPETATGMIAAGPQARLPLDELRAADVLPPVAAGPSSQDEGGVCLAPAGLFQKGGASTLPPLATTDPDEFGRGIAAAARAQTRDLVIYDDRYRRISYPMGDVPSFYGVCTDVVIRAYREMGIDLQALVQQTGMGSGDTSIDHRRTETLRRFLARHGESFPVSQFAENYRPGDIVSYYRPQNSRSRSHVAVVAAEMGPSGRPMIIHNRGWGVQMEDALFVDQITGHYRFSGLKSPTVAAAPRPARPHPALQPARTPPIAKTTPAAAPRAKRTANAPQSVPVPGSPQ